MSNYIDDAHRTLSPQYFPQHVDDAKFFELLNNIVVRAGALDKMKKSMFYGKANADHQPMYPVTDGSGTVPVNVIHGIVGIITEAGELAVALTNSMDAGHPVDFVNLAEELGDIFWYAALIAKEAGFTFEEIQDKNIAKLKARYPEKFDSDLAENRDLEKERKILESKNPAVLIIGGGRNCGKTLSKKY